MILLDTYSVIFHVALLKYFTFVTKRKALLPNSEVAVMMTLQSKTEVEIKTVTERKARSGIP